MGAAISLAAHVAVPLGGGALMSIVTRDDVKGWYTTLKKPKWNPPNKLFGPVWGVLYVSMGAASWAVSRVAKANRGAAVALYAAQLAFNMAWTPLFFKEHKLDVALADSAAMLGFGVAATMAMAKAAGGKTIVPLMAPYLAWVSFATVLNGELLRLNPDQTLVDYKDLKSKLGKAGEGAVKAASEAGKQIGKGVNEAGKQIGKGVNEAGNKIKSVGKGGDKAAKSAAGKAQDASKAAAAKAGDAGKAAAGAADDAAKATTSAAADAAKSAGGAAKSAGGAVADAAKSAGGAVEDAAKSAGGAASGAAKSAGGAADDALKSAGGAAKSAGGAADDALKSAGGAAADAAETTAKAADDVVEAVAKEL